MAIRVTYTPPKINAAERLAVAAPLAAMAGAEVLLAASLPLVPVASEDLKKSGRVEAHGHGAAVIYDAVSPDGYPYGIRQHEDLELHHPNGGQAKFLEQPMHSEHVAILAAEAAVIRAALA
jgi:hypothetical protein